MKTQGDFRVDLHVSLEVEANSREEVKQMLHDMDYNFVSQTENVEILETEITEQNIWELLLKYGRKMHKH